MEFKVITKNNNLSVEVYSEFIKKEEIKTNKALFSEMCKKCRNYDKKYSCPPNSPNFNTICKGEGLYVILLKITLQNINSTEYNKVQLANSILKSKIDKILRELEIEFKTKYLSSGSCRLCKKCKLQNNLPCKYPLKMRFSLESVGIDCNSLSEILFNLPLLWYKNKKAPEYTCVLAGLICNENQKMKIKNKLDQLIKNA